MRPAAGAIALIKLRGCSSAGRALHSHCRGQGFDPPQLHLVLTYDISVVSADLFARRWAVGRRVPMPAAWLLQDTDTTKAANSTSSRPSSLMWLVEGYQAAALPALSFPQFSDMGDVVLAVPGVQLQHQVECHRSAIGMIEGTRKVRSFHHIDRQYPTFVHRLEHLE